MNCNSKKQQAGFLLNPFRFSNKLNNAWLLLHGLGTPGDTIFTDSSGNNRVVTADYGAVITLQNGRFFPTSMLFTGINSAFDSGAVVGGAPLSPGSQDFTIGTWVNRNAGPAAILFDTRPYHTNGRYVTILINDDGSIIYYTDSSTIITTHSGSINNNSNTHLAICRKNGVLFIYSNGINVGETSHTQVYADGFLTIGRSSWDGYSGFNGLLSEVLVTYDALYDGSNFTPPSSPYVI